MRTTAIPIHVNQKIEVFIAKHKGHFELWVVGPVKGRRIILDHYLTHDNLEAHLEYAKPGDLTWRDATLADIPAERHKNAIQIEATAKRKTFRDYDNAKMDEMEALARRASGLQPWSGSHQSVATHLTAIALLATDREGVEAANRLILGRWTDGVVTMSFEPGHKLRWACSGHHLLNPQERNHGLAPDWWNFAMWGIALLNQQHKQGTLVGLLRVNEKELHLNVGVLGPSHRIAHVFKRIGRPEEKVVLTPGSNRPNKRKHVTGIAPPLLRQLEQAIAHKNPFLAERLKPALLESDIRIALKKARVMGAIDPLIQLYSWRDGVPLDEKTPMGETSFFPDSIYQFMDLNTAIQNWRTMNDAAEQLSEMLEGTEAESLFKLTGQYFPVFSDGSTGSLAVDLEPCNKNRVVMIEFESAKPVREAYKSFDELIIDAIRAYNEREPLACFES